MSMTGRYLRLPIREIKRLCDRPDTLLAVLYPESDESTHHRLDIDKTWHIIHYLLNGQPWNGAPPLGNIVLGGKEVSDEDLGYGPARFLTPAEVAELNDALARLSSDAVWTRYDPKKAEQDEVYWSNDEESKAYFAENYEALRRFISAASAAREGLILWLA
jgi:hypothetical protein